MRSNSKNARAAQSDSAIATAGEVFDDGTLIELVEDLSQPSGLGLLKWDGCRALTSPRIVHARKAYVPLPLDPTIRRALRLPSTSSDFVSTAALFDELLAVATKFTDLAQPFCELLVSFVIASWLADRLPQPINLSLWSPVAPDGARILLLLSSLCRLPLLLTGVNAADLRALPGELPATLLILRPASSRRTHEFLAASGWRGFHSARSGRLVEFLGAKALSTDAPLDDRMVGCTIQIPVTRSMRSLPALDKRALQELSTEFLPKLLRFRLRHCGSARGARGTEAVDVAPGGQLSSALRVCFRDEPELGDRLVAQLIEVGENGGEGPLDDPRALLLEVVWSRCHSRERDKLRVAEVALDLNAALSRIGELKLSERMVGGLLRSIGLRTHRLGQDGRGLMLDPPTRRRIHHFARVRNVRSAKQPFPGCAECAQLETSRS